MKKNITVPRGTADILPQEAGLWQDMEKIARGVFGNYNFREIRTPVFEETGLFKRSLGQSSDVVNKQLLELAAQRQESSDPVTLADLALRPEGTASVVRSYVENSMDRKEPVSKFYYIGPMFRGERPQKGRLRQFHQIGAEILGPGANQPYQDAEMISLAVNLLKSFGLGNFKLKINTLGNAEDKEKFSQTLRNKLQPYLNDLSEYSRQRYDRNVFRVLDSKDAKDREIIGKLDLDYSFLSSQSLENYETVKTALTDIGIVFEEDICLVRGLDYYNYTVFEILDDSLGSQNALGAGGRYNNLAGFLGGDKYAQVGGIGFSLGMERILLSLNKNPEDCARNPELYLVALGDAAYKKAFQILSVLRGAGISCEMNYSNASLKSQMRAADKSGALGTIVLGEEEMRQKQCVLKQMGDAPITQETNIIQLLADCGLSCRKENKSC